MFHYLDNSTLIWFVWNFIFDGLYFWRGSDKKGKLVCHSFSESRLDMGH